jgi:putative molybdopterin biosynthesis protein
MTEPASSTGAGLRLARQVRGFSQQQLASMAGVSRQAVSAVESGHSDPSLRVALALAQALGMSVEDLFGPGEPAAPVAAISLAPLRDGARLRDGAPARDGAHVRDGAPARDGAHVRDGAPARDGAHARDGAGQHDGPSRVMLAPVGDRFVALPLRGDTGAGLGFLPAGGLAVPLPYGTAGVGSGQAGAGPEQVSVRPIGPPRPTLVVAGCDPALPLLATPLALLDPPVAFAWWPCGSGAALRLAQQGLVHAAGVHTQGDRESSGQALPAGATQVGFTAWREGLVLRPGQRPAVDGVAAIAERRLRIVNREPGAEARRLLDAELRRNGIAPEEIAGYDTRAAGHLQVAAAIAAGLADAGVASEPAARAYGLAFVPLAEERFSLVIPAEHAASREVQALLKVLASPWLLAQLASLPGYDATTCGERAATNSP